MSDDERRLADDPSFARETGVDLDGDLDLLTDVDFDAVRRAVVARVSGSGPVGDGGDGGGGGAGEGGGGSGGSSLSGGSAGGAGGSSPGGSGLASGVPGWSVGAGLGLALALVLVSVLLWNASHDDDDGGKPSQTEWPDRGREPNAASASSAPPSPTAAESPAPPQRAPAEASNAGHVEDILVEDAGAGRVSRGTGRSRLGPAVRDEESNIVCATSLEWRQPIDGAVAALGDWVIGRLDEKFVRYRTDARQVLDPRSITALNKTRLDRTLPVPFGDKVAYLVENRLILVDDRSVKFVRPTDPDMWAEAQRIVHHESEGMLLEMEGGHLRYVDHQMTTKWTHERGSSSLLPFTEPGWVVARGRVVGVDHTRSPLVLNLEDGKPATTSIEMESFVLEHGASFFGLMFGNNKGVLHAFDHELEPIWQADTGRLSTAPIVHHQGAWAATVEGELVALDEDGRVVARETLASPAVEILAVRENALVRTEGKLEVFALVDDDIESCGVLELENRVANMTVGKIGWVWVSSPPELIALRVF